MTEDGHVPDNKEFMDFAENIEATQGGIVANVVNLLLSSETRPGPVSQEKKLHVTCTTVNIYSYY